MDSTGKDAASYMSILGYDQGMDGIDGWIVQARMQLVIWLQAQPWDCSACDCKLRYEGACGGKLRRHC